MDETTFLKNGEMKYNEFKWKLENFLVLSLHSTTYSSCDLGQITFHLSVSHVENYSVLLDQQFLRFFSPFETFLTSKSLWVCMYIEICIMHIQIYIQNIYIRTHTYIYMYGIPLSQPHLTLPQSLQYIP